MSRQVVIRNLYSILFRSPAFCNDYKVVHHIANFQPIRPSSYRSSNPVEDASKYTSNYEISKDPEEWKFVEQLLPLKTVPKPVPKSEYPSGWKPQIGNFKNAPYYIERTKNYMQPVYLRRTYRGMRRITQVRRISGDIWALEEALKKYIETKNNTKILSQVNEVCGQIHIKGDYVNDIKGWMDQKGF